MMDINTDEVQLLTSKDVARLLRLNERTLRRWRMAGQGPRFLQLEASIRYRLKDVQDWLAQRSGSSSTAQAQIRALNIPHFPVKSAKIGLESKDGDRI